MDKNWKVKFFLTMVFSIFMVLYTLPTFLNMPSWFSTISDSKLKLGLDLKGGLSLVYQVEVDDAIISKLDMLADDINTRLEKNEIKLKELAHVVDKDQSIELILEDPEKADEAKDFALNLHSDLLETDRKDGKLTFSFSKRSINKLKKDAVNKAIDTIRRRINTMGVGEQEVVRYGSEDMYSIEVRLPGLKEEDFKKTKDIISKTAQLEFKIVDDDSDIMDKIKAANEKLPEGINFVASSYLVEKTGESVPDKYYRTENVTEIDPIKKKNKLHDDLKKLTDFIDTVKVPYSHILAYSLINRGNQSYYRTYLLKKKTVLTGEYITETRSLVDTRNNSPYVGITFSTRGAEIFGQLTKANKHRRMAILLDQLVDTAPIIQDEILGGQATITMGGGSYTEKVREAEMLKLLLKAGSLPASLTKGEERRVGATLGEESIKAGSLAMAVGGIFILLFMLIYYRLAGLIANTALILNIFFILAVMAFLGASLSLPGIAGIVLTVGMSVDANVIIYERIREELDLGRPPVSAVKFGYEKAFSAIIDANITTMIAAFILYNFGSGPVQGFAVTLIVGILSSMFTAIIVTRLFFDYLVLGKKVKKLSI